MAISHPQPKSFEEIISSKRYEVPVYQRPYTWQIEQVSELWNDLNKNESPYFIGTLILRPKINNNDIFEVVDGQQRLATLLLLLKAAVKTIEKEDETRALAIQDRYINQKGPLTDQPLLTLVLSRRDKEKFETLMLETEFLSKKRYLSWSNLDNTMDFFLEKLGELKKDRGLEGVISVIKDKVMKLSFLDVQLENDSDIYMLFETLNDRGIDLSIADLVKNRVCAMADDQPDLSADDAARKIDNISEMLSSGKMKGFLLHYCWSESSDKEPLPRRKLMEWYSKTIETRKVKFLNDIEDAAERYVYFINPRSISNEPEKRDVFTYLKILDATRCYPLLLQGSKTLEPKDFICLCKAVEILTFRHSTIAKQDAKKLEDVYYDLTKNIKNGMSINPILEVLKKQAEKISGRIFETNFSEFESDNHQISRYILCKIEEQVIPKSATLNWDDLTLEHILSQGLPWDGKDQYINRLGNLTLLSGLLNKDASNKEFETKKEDYKKEKRIQITKDLVKYLDFTKETILKRQKQFAKIASKIWDPKKIV